MRGLASALCVACGLIGLVPPAHAEVGRSATFDYLYIEANEGGSSGGHTAIRFGSHIYHFQNRDGLLVLDRERSGDFLFAYALLNNRTVHVSSIAVDEDVATRLADRFLDRYQAQTAQLAVHAALERDLELLENLDSPTVSVRGYGYFRKEFGPESGQDVGQEVRQEPDPDGDAPSALRALREKIVQAHGIDFLPARRRALRRALVESQAEDPSAWPVKLPESPQDHPIFAQPWSTRLADLAAGLAALDVLERSPPLDPAALNIPSGDDFRLQPDERLAIASFARQLETQLIGLVDSLREDWGQTLLIGMARLAALEASLATDRFVFLDSFPEAYGAIDVYTLRSRTEIVPMMLDETRGQLAGARRYFARTERPDELAWERVEERLVRHRELLRAVAGEQELRLARGHLLPGRAAPYALPPFAWTTGSTAESELSGARARIRSRLRAYAARLRSLHLYGLVYRNCVTEIFDTVNAEFAEYDETSRDALGGVVVAGTDSLGFIPFVSAHQVDARYRILARYTLPSYRDARLREMRATLSPFWLGLRESNTLTARSYRRGDNDSFFVFFSEDPIWLRPVFGVVNLAAGVGQSVWGLAMLPFDRGQALVSGLKGAFVSLPELFFGNIRKGSNDWIEPDFRDVELRSVEHAESPPSRTRSNASHGWRPLTRKVGALARRPKSTHSR